MVNMADEKPKFNFDSISAKLKEHAEREHLDEIEERLGDVHRSYKKSVGNKFKLDEKQAEALGHKLYDELIDYVAGYYKNSSNEIKALKGKKGKHGESMLDSIVEHEFELDRAQFVKRLKKAAESGTKFTGKYVRELLSDNLEKYHGNKQQKIVKDLGIEHKADLQKQIDYFIKNHKIPDAKRYAGALKPTADFNEVLGTYATLASNFYNKDAAAKPK